MPGSKVTINVESSSSSIVPATNVGTLGNSQGLKCTLKDRPALSRLSIHARVLFADGMRCHHSANSHIPNFSLRKVNYYMHVHNSCKSHSRRRHAVDPVSRRREVH
jgi:hypothetical protein